MACRRLAFLVAVLLGCRLAAARRTSQPSGTLTDDKAALRECPPRDVKPDGKGHCIDSETHTAVPLVCCKQSRECRSELHRLQLGIVHHIQGIMPCSSTEDLQMMFTQPGATDLHVSKSQACSPECQAYLESITPKRQTLKPGTFILNSSLSSSPPKDSSDHAVHKDNENIGTFDMASLYVDLMSFTGRCRETMRPSDVNLVNFTRSQARVLLKLVKKLRAFGKCAKEQVAREKPRVCPLKLRESVWSDCKPMAAGETPLDHCPVGCLPFVRECDTLWYTFVKWTFLSTEKKYSIMCFR